MEFLKMLLTIFAYTAGIGLFLLLCLWTILSIVVGKDNAKFDHEED
jgi:hypothetical protein